MKDLDNFITNIVTKKINEPQEYENAIRTAFDNSSSKIQKLRRVPITICSLILLTTSIVYATEIKDFVIKYFYNHDTGIDTAIENGYIDVIEENDKISNNVELSINNMSSEAYNTEIGIKNMLMDDYNLNFTFSIDISKDIDITEIDDIQLYGVLITDENNNILYSRGKDLFDEYCLNNNLNYSYHEYNEHHMGASLTGGITKKDTVSNSIDFSYSLINNRQYAYPKSENLNIIVQEIRMIDKDVFPAEEKYILKGNWNLYISVNEKFSNRESINYVVKNNIYDNIDVTEAKLDNTGFTFKCTILEDALYDNNISDEEKQKIINDFQDYYLIDGEYVGNYIIDCYLEDELGNKYYTPEIGISNPYRFDFVTGKLYYRNCFTYTKFLQTDTIKIHFNLNLPNDTRNICIELEK